MKSTSEAGEHVTVTYTLPSGSTITISDSATRKGVVRPNFEAGSGKTGIYWIQFNRTDQIAIKNGGTAAVIGILCIAGPVVCAIAGVIGAVAASYLNSTGFCPGNQQLRFYYHLDGDVYRSTCVAG